jgi:hypothetical protein
VAGERMHNEVQTTGRNIRSESYDDGRGARRRRKKNSSSKNKKAALNE